MRRETNKRLSLLLSGVCALTLVLGVPGFTEAAETNPDETAAVGQTDTAQQDAAVQADDAAQSTEENRDAASDGLKADELSAKVWFFVPNEYGSSTGYGKGTPNSDHVVISKSTTFEQFKAAIDAIAPDYTRFSFRGVSCTGWDYSELNKNYENILKDFDSYKTNGVTVYVHPTFGDHQIVSIKYKYPAANRDAYSWGFGNFLVDKDFDLTAALRDQEVIPDLNKDLKYTWVTNIKEDDLKYDGERGYWYCDDAEAGVETQNYLVSYYISDYGVDYDDKATTSWIAPANDQVKLPAEVNGKKVKWTYRVEGNGVNYEPLTVMQDGTYTINSNVSFHGYWDDGRAKEIDSSEENEFADQIKTDPYFTDEALSKYRNENGKAQIYEVRMKGATVAPQKILEAAKGKDLDIDLEMGAYSWTINGKDIKDTSNKVDLEVLEKMAAVPADAVKNLAGDRETKQFSLTYNGEFGFKATLNINVGADNAGKYENLFWYKSDGTFEFITSGQVQEDGTVGLAFTHASDYVLVQSESAMSAVDAKNANDKIIAEKTAASGAKKSPKTGEF